ncbi:hypothetical protein GGR53DRAFT_147150 [Hypoxylon sp. FL1150]|nr:hypothetical protein GGR53DRAFT_147150 [Hypoxylon sp. FL1150]
MAPVTELVLAATIPGASQDSLFTIFSTLKTQPGSQRVRAATLHEDPQQLRLFIDWDAVESHYAFRSSPGYGAFMSEITSLTAGPATAHPPAVLDSGKTAVAEMLLTYFAPEADAAKNKAAALTLVSGLTGAGFAGINGESAVGWTVEKDVAYKGEKTRALVILIGWDSVEAHRKARATDVYGKLVADFQGAAEGLKGFDISHVTTKML